MRAVMLAVAIFWPGFVVSQTYSTPIVHQEHSESDREKNTTPPNNQRLGEITDRLRRNVNGKAVVRNQCESGGEAVEVEESTEVTEINGCKMTFKTLKTSTSPDGRRGLEFTIYANLAELTTPASVAKQTFPHCQPSGGDVLKVMSQAEPGKKIRATRRATSRSAMGTSGSDEAEVEIARSDLSFFFADPIAAKKAARLLDQAVKLCGGKEWPDEDDLP
jgi:hypothetical protein